MKSPQDTQGGSDFLLDAPDEIAEGTPIRCGTFPGTTSHRAIIRRINDDLAGWADGWTAVAHGAADGAA